MLLQAQLTAENVRLLLLVCQSLERLVKASIQTSVRLSGGVRRLKFDSNADQMSSIMVVDPEHTRIVLRITDLEEVCGPGFVDPDIQIRSTLLFGSEDTFHVESRNANRVGMCFDPRHLSETLTHFKDCDSVSLRLVQWTPSPYRPVDQEDLEQVQAKGVLHVSGEVKEKFELLRKTVVRTLSGHQANAVHRPVDFKQAVIFSIAHLERLRMWMDLVRQSSSDSIEFLVEGKIPGYEKWLAERAPIKVRWGVDVVEAKAAPPFFAALEVPSVSVNLQSNPRDSYFYSSLYEAAGPTQAAGASEPDIDFQSSGVFCLRHFHSLVVLADTQAYRDPRALDGKRASLAWFPATKTLKLIVYLDDVGSARAILQLSAIEAGEREEE